MSNKPKKPSAKIRMGSPKMAFMQPKAKTTRELIKRKILIIRMRRDSK
jgi:hypothetical protein